MPHKSLLRHFNSAFLVLYNEQYISLWQILFLCDSDTERDLSSDVLEIHLTLKFESHGVEISPLQVIICVT